MTTKYVRIAFQLALMTCVSLMAIYLFTEFRFTFGSDDAVRSVLVKIAIGRRNFLVTDWVYANGDLFLATPYPINLIVSRFISEAFSANALSSLIGYLILLGCFYKFCSSVDWKYREIPLLSTIFLASGISASNLEFVVAQGIYSTYSGFALLAASMLINRTTQRQSRMRLIACLSLSFILAISNPKRTLAQFLLPVLLAGIFTALVKERSNSEEALTLKLLARSIAPIVVGCGLGAAIYYGALLPKVTNFDSAASIISLSPSETIKRLLNFPLAWIRYLQARPDPREFDGFGKAIEYASGFIAAGLILGPLVSLFGIRQMSKMKRFILMFGVAQCFISVIAMVTNKNLFLGYGEIRYLSIGVMCFIPFFLEVAGQFAQRVRIFGGVVLIFLIYVITITALWAWPGSLIVAEQSAVYTQRLDMINTLKSNGACTVLATYWNSYVNSVAGNFGVLFYPVEVSGVVQFQPHHSYRGPALASCNRSALLLSEAELTPALREMINLQFGTSASEVTIDSYRALIFDTDIYTELLQEQAPQNTSLPSAAFSLGASKKLFDRCGVNSGCQQQVTVTNLGAAALSSRGSLPLRLGIQGLDRDSRVIENDAGRIDFPVPLTPGKTEVLHFELPTAGKNIDKYQLCVVQDGVGWHCDRTTVKKN